MMRTCFLVRRRSKRKYSRNFTAAWKTNALVCRSCRRRRRNWWGSWDVGRHRAKPPPIVRLEGRAGKPHVVEGHHASRRGTADYEKEMSLVSRGISLCGTITVSGGRPTPEFGGRGA